MKRIAVGLALASALLLSMATGAAAGYNEGNIGCAGGRSVHTFIDGSGWHYHYFDYGQNLWAPGTGRWAASHDHGSATTGTWATETQGTLFSGYGYCAF